MTIRVDGVLANTTTLAEIRADLGVPAITALAAPSGSDLIGERTVAQLLASTEPARGVGAVWRAGGFLYAEAASSAADWHVLTAGGVKLYVLPGEKGISAWAFGMPSGGDDQAALNRMWLSSEKRLHMPPGVYRGSVDNTTSGRTIYWDEGAILDGVAHVAVGRGPDSNGDATITWVDDTRVIGTVTATIRVGCFYCRRLNCDKWVVTENNPAYVNQTAIGGSSGMNIFAGSKDVFVGEAIVRSTIRQDFAFAIQRGPTNNADNWPENVRIGRVIVRGNTRTALRTNTTINTHIEDFFADSWGLLEGASLTADTNLRVDKIRIVGTPNPSTPARDGIYVLNGISASFGEVEVSGASQIGFRTFNSGRVDADVIRASGNALDQVRIESPGRIGRIITSGMGTGVGVLIQGAAAGLEVGTIRDNGGGGVTVTPADVTIDRVISLNNPATNKYGLFLNGAARAYVGYLLADNNNQGLRMINAANPTFGNLIIQNNATAISASNATGIAYETLLLSGNASDGNLVLNLSSGFRGSLQRASAATLLDADATLTVGVSAVTRILATSLTAQRTVTLSTTGAQNGDRFRIARTNASGGAFNLVVTPIAGITSANLAQNQWLEVEFLGGVWQMTARGALT